MNDIVHKAPARSDRRFIDAGDVLHCDGSVSPVTNIWAVEMNPVEWDDWNSEASAIPDPRTMSAVIFECRSPAGVAEISRLLAEGLDVHIWIAAQQTLPGPLTKSFSPDRPHLPQTACAAANRPVAQTAALDLRYGLPS